MGLRQRAEEQPHECDNPIEMFHGISIFQNFLLYYKTDLEYCKTLPGNIGVPQMKGAGISTTNNSSFGNVTALNDAGNYETATICSIIGDSVFLFHLLQNTYTKIVTNLFHLTLSIKGNKSLHLDRD